MSPDLRAKMDPRLENVTTNLGFGNVLQGSAGSDQEDENAALPLEVRKAIS